MKTVRDVMTTDIIWLTPENKVKTAIILMKGRGIGGLPVLDGDQVVGMLYYHDILGRDTEIPVQHIMNTEFVTIPPNMPIADAADLMAKIGHGRLLVVEGPKLVGLVTRGDLLPEIGKSLDLLTGLLRVDAMRDWGINALRRGQEITVIFIDLDQFGGFNKKYGHITGDRVLKHVAGILQASVDEERDLLCRYAGDEFVIVTIRPGDEARVLASEIGERIRATQDPDLPEPVTGTLGVYGGKRTKERDQVHYDATLDNLINLASKACTLAKSTPAASLDGSGAPATSKAPEVPLPTAAPVVRESERLLNIQSLNLSWGAGETATAEVEITDGTTSHKRSRSGFALGKSALRLVADAAADAVSEFLPPSGYGIMAENVHVVSDSNSEDIVLVTVLLVTPQKQIRVSGSSIIKQDAYRATAAALLDAVNRQIFGT
jgi:IMP dehydrogenase